MIQMNQHNLCLQTNLFQAKNQNFMLGGNSLAESLSSIVAMVNQSQGKTSAVSYADTLVREEVSPIPEQEVKGRPYAGVSGAVDFSYEGQLEKKMGETYQNLSGQADRMESLAEFLTVAEKYEELAQTEGISEAERENALATAANIKEYVATNLTTGSAVYQHLHRNDDANFQSFQEGMSDGTLDEMREKGTEASQTADHLENLWNATVDTQKELAEHGVDLSVQDIFQGGSSGVRETTGIPTDREELDKLSTSQLKELLMSASDTYQQAADTVKDVYAGMYGEASANELQYESMDMSPEAVINRLADCIQSMDNASLAGQIKGNLQSIQLAFSVEGSTDKAVVYDKLVEISQVEVELKPMDEAMSQNIQDDIASTAIKQQILGNYYYA